LGGVGGWQGQCVSLHVANKRCSLGGAFRFTIGCYHKYTIGPGSKEELISTNRRLVKRHKEAGIPAIWLGNYQPSTTIKPTIPAAVPR
jgi:hypothetical protein